MSGHPPFKCGDKPHGKKVLALWKQCTPQDNTRPSVMPCLSKRRSFPSRANDSSNKVIKTVKIDHSSTESTNLSDQDQVNNVLTLREEIHEWRRQEATRSNINYVVGKKKTQTDGAITNEMNVHTYPETSVIELSQECKENISKIYRYDKS